MSMKFYFTPETVAFNASKVGIEKVIWHVQSSAATKPCKLEMEIKKLFVCKRLLINLFVK